MISNYTSNLFISSNKTIKSVEFKYMEQLGEIVGVFFICVCFVCFDDIKRGHETIFQR